MKSKPTGFVAICRCGVSVGAIDYSRTDRKEAGKIIGKWLDEGCTIVPNFFGTRSVEIGLCQCVSFEGGES